MRVEFVREGDESNRVVGAASWAGSGVEPEPGDEGSREILARVFRLAPVKVDDSSLRSFGTNGDVTLQPGSIRWFIAAARVRGEAEGLKPRFITEAQGALGWDPAGAYRTFVSNAERLGARPSGSTGPARP